MFGPFRDSNPLNFLYPCLFVVRAGVFAGIMALWHLKGFTQLLILSVVSAGMLAFVASFKPFKV